LGVNKVSMLVENCFSGMWLAAHSFAEVSGDRIFKKHVPLKRGPPRPVFKFLRKWPNFKLHKQGS